MPSLHPRSLFPAALIGMAMTAATPALAHSYKVGAIEIGHIWAKPPVHGALAIYGPLFNSGGKPDTLVGVQSSAARSAYIARTVNGHEQPVRSIALQPGRPVSLASWTQHIVLQGVKGNVHAKSMVPLTLRFAHAGTVKVMAMVENAPSD